MQLHARHFETLRPVTLHIDGDRITDLSEYSCPEHEAQSIPIVAPGFFDIQLNGYSGKWFCSPDVTVNDVVEVNQELVNRGVAKYFPTLITASFDALHHGFTTLRQACEQNAAVAACVAGYHLEGPYISAVDGPRGAHPIQHVRPADYDEFTKLQVASGNRIRLVTLAAEAENAVPFIHQCRSDGVVVAIGHTAATSEQIQAAAEAGAQLSTHLGNGAHGSLPRHPNYIWDQLAEDRLWASIISDGCHVPPSVLKCFLKCKTADRTIITSDVSGFGGCQPGIYGDGDVAAEVLDDGRIVVAGQRQFLAGSGAITGDCIVHMAHACNLPLSTAVRMATVNPAQLFGEPTPELEVGAAATLTLFHTTAAGESQTPRFVPHSTIVDGQLLSQES